MRTRARVIGAAGGLQPSSLAQSVRPAPMMRNPPIRLHGAPIGQYLMAKQADEIALATAAPRRLQSRTTLRSH